MRILVVVLIVFVLSGCMTSKLIREHREARSLPIETLNFTLISDGIYIGYYEGGMCGWRQNRVAVTIENGAVAEIKQLYTNDPGAGDTLSETLAERIVKQQSLDVDAVSGATLTSRAFIKAVEIALKGETVE